MQTQDEIIARRVLDRIIGDATQWRQGLTIQQVRKMGDARDRWYATTNN